MNIHSTIQALYAVLCEAQALPEKGDNMATLLRSVTDDDVSKAVSDVNALLGELRSVQDKLQSLYILHFECKIDSANKKLLLVCESPWGGTTLKFVTAFDETAAQSLVDGLQMGLAMLKAGDRLAAGGEA